MDKLTPEQLNELVRKYKKAKNNEAKAKMLAKQALAEQEAERFRSRQKW